MASAASRGDDASEADDLERLGSFFPGVHVLSV
jgi:hypothetical protein